MIADNERLSQCAYRIDEDFYQIKYGFSQRFFSFDTMLNNKTTTATVQNIHWKKA